MAPGDLAGKYVIGELYSRDDGEEYTQKYEKIIEKAGR
jgi:hypothetical protein